MLVYQRVCIGENNINPCDTNRPRPSLSILKWSNLRLMRQRGPKAQALLQMIAGPGDSERNLLTWEIPTYWNRKKTGLLASKKTMSSWHFLCKLWKVVAPPQWNVFLIHVCYIWWHRYIHICVHTDISTIHLTTILIKWIQMNQLSGSELYGIVCKKNICFILMFLVKSLRNYKVGPPR